jgi:hypothetical protein
MERQTKPSNFFYYLQEQKRLLKESYDIFHLVCNGDGLANSIRSDLTESRRGQLPGYFPQSRSRFDSNRLPQLFFNLLFFLLELSYLAMYRLYLL